MIQMLQRDLISKELTGAHIHNPKVTLLELMLNSKSNHAMKKIFNYLS